MTEYDASSEIPQMNPPDDQESPAPLFQENPYWLATCTIIVKSDEMPNPMTRTVNVILKSDKFYLNRLAISQIQHLALAKVVEEGDITPADVRDIVINGVSWLGMMSDEEFGEDPEESAGEDAA